MTRPRGKPADAQRDVEARANPVGITFTSGGAIPSPRRMMLPLPNCFSIVDTATSIAFSRPGSRSRIAATVASLSAFSTFSPCSGLLSLFSVVVVAMSSSPLVRSQRGP
jgi:hypothetical protein